MALPKWITPAGELGIVPELEYYEFTLDAYDASGGTLVYTLQSGTLPLGIQIVPTGKLVGVPVSDVSTGESSVPYRFTIRVRNTSTQKIADRTFSLTITNVAPPIISYPIRNSDLGTYFDGTVVDLQLEAVEFSPGAPLIWSLKSGDLPKGLSLSSTGVLSGFIYPVSTTSPGYSTGWDESAWNFLGWDFPVVAINKTFTFTVEVFDGVNYDLSTYSLTVFPRRGITVDNNLITIDTSTYFSGLPLTVDLGAKHNPYITTVQSDLVPIRQGSYFAFNVDSIDIDGDVVNYAIPQSATGGFDEQEFSVSSLSYPYLATSVVDGRLYSGVWPKVSIATSAATIDLFPGNVVTAYVGNVITQPSTGAEAIVSANVVNSSTIPVTLVGSNFTYSVGNIYLDGVKLENDRYEAATSSWANVGVVPQNITNDVAVVVTDPTRSQLSPGNQVKILEPSVINGVTYDLWYLATVTSSITLRLTGSNNISASPGQYISQPFSLSNALITNVSTTTGTINIGGNILVGRMTIGGSRPTYTLNLSSGIQANIGQYITEINNGANGVVTANTIRYITLGGSTINAKIGDYLTQGSANARIIQDVDNSGLVYVDFISGPFTTGSGYVKINGVSTTAFPVAVYATATQVSILSSNASAFTSGTNSWIAINGSNANAYISSVSVIPNPIVIKANIGDIISQPSTGAIATITANVSDVITIPVTLDGGIFTLGSGNLKINGSNVNAYPDTISAAPVVVGATAYAGNIITQASTGATAVVTANVSAGLAIPVEFTSGDFATGFGSGNLKISGSNVKIYPVSTVHNTDITATYLNPAYSFLLNSNVSTAAVFVNAISTNSYISSIVSVGVTVGSQGIEGTVGFDGGKFEQGRLALPIGLNIEPSTGWVTGYLPYQTVNELNYPFEVRAFKRDDPTYFTTKLFTLTILGDLNNTINWITPSNLGTIENGKVSDISVKALSSKGKVLYYNITPGYYTKLPQGLTLTSGGALSGRVSFELFSLDKGTTLIDPNAIGISQTTFDQNYTFTVTASDINQIVSANRTFTIKVIGTNVSPYENLYLRAFLTPEQRITFQNIVQDKLLFPPEIVYRQDDPWFGVAREVKTLFLPGLHPSTLSMYAEAADKNHFIKKLSFGTVKTAQVLDADFNVKYEVIYIEISDFNTNSQGKSPESTIDLIDQIANPYYDSEGNAYTVAYPNAFGNMQKTMVDALGYANKGALPDWMTSKQPDGKVLGFTRAVVLAYTVPGASELVKYRLNQLNFNFNQLDFTVDRYDLDNTYSDNYDIAANAFITSSETTFDRFPGLPTTFIDYGTVDYAVSLSFEQINNHSVSTIRDLGGLDGVKNFRDGDTLVFAKQEFVEGGFAFGSYDTGWSNITSVWDSENWDDNRETFVSSDDAEWDPAGYVPGYNEHNIDPTVVNQRMGVWKVHISDSSIVTLSPIYTSFRANTGGVASNLLQVTQIVGGVPLTPNRPIEGVGVPIGTKIQGQVSGTTGGIGVYRLSGNVTVAKDTIVDTGVGFYYKLLVKNGQSYGDSSIYYDPIVKQGKNIPTYSMIPQQIALVSTRFDGNGTRFFDYRDNYKVPGQGDKYIKFAKNGVFT